MNSPLTKEDLKEVVEAAFEKHQNSDHHQFIQALVEKEQRNKELYEKIKAHVAGWVVVAAIGFVAVSVWKEVIDGVKKFFTGL